MDRILINPEKKDDRLTQTGAQIVNHEVFEQALGNGEGQGNPLCCSPSGHKESDTPGRLNNS